MSCGFRRCLYATLCLLERNKWQAGTMTEYLEIAFIEIELEAALKEFGEAHQNIWLSGLPCIGIRVVGFDDLPQINQRCLMTK
jgi:hypothetical protein